MEAKISTVIGFLIIFAVILPTAWFCYTKWLAMAEATSFQAAAVSQNKGSDQVGTSEKKKIDQWILKNNLNQYGDPKNTVYAGGSPLFNEASGQTVDRYQYILEKHPDRPWNK